MTFSEFIDKFQKVPFERYPNRVIHNPLVSVCVQTYQHASYIRDCLNGILKQRTSFEFEILLGEDGSGDGTREICIDYANQYPERIRLVLHRRENNVKINGVPTGRFNFVNNLFSARGKYIAICEGDDYWSDPSKLQKQVDFLETNPEFVLTYHGWVSDVEGDVDHDKVYSKFRTLTLLFRNDLSAYRIPYNVINADTTLRFYLSTIGEFRYLNDIRPAVHRFHAGGMWSRKESAFKVKNKIETLEYLVNVYRDTPHLQRAKRMLAQQVINNEDVLFASEDYKKASLVRYIFSRAILWAYLGLYVKSKIKKLMQ